MLKVCLAGATGWAGSELARGIAAVDDLELVSAVSRTHAGRELRDVLGDDRLATPVFGSAAEALSRPCDVFVEYTTTSPRSMRWPASARAASSRAGTSP